MPGHLSPEDHLRWHKTGNAATTSKLHRHLRSPHVRSRWCRQVMQDSLGGNAKTLMFVNISPADYNQEETATALTYATRVKLITNTASKQQVRSIAGTRQGDRVPVSPRHQQRVEIKCC